MIYYTILFYFCKEEMQIFAHISRISSNSYALRKHTRTAQNRQDLRIICLPQT